MRSRAKVSFQRDTTVVVTSKADTIAKALKDDPRLAGSPVLPEKIVELVTTLRKLEADAQAADKAASEARKRAEVVRAELNTKLQGVGSWVDLKADGDASLIIAAGFEVKGARTAKGSVGAPTGLSVTTSDKKGRVDVAWNRVPGARAYVLEQTSDPTKDTGWVQVAMPGRSRCTISGLEPGKVYTFRVAALGPTEPGPFSDPITRMAV